MIDSISIERILNLHPSIVDEGTVIYNEIAEKLPDELMLRFSCTLRSFAESNELYAQGRTKLFDAKGKRLGIVTNAKAGQSMHNYGLAVDVVFLVDKDKNGTFETCDFSTNNENFKMVVSTFKKYGWEWGGDWKFKDTPHFQKTFGHTWRRLFALYNSKNFINGTNYIQL